MLLLRKQHKTHKKKKKKKLRKAYERRFGKIMGKKERNTKVVIRAGVIIGELRTKK